MATESESEEEVLFEIEAVESVYGDDCQIIQRFPPHLRLHLKPRTADDSSQQFVEAILELRAGSQYPKEPPQIGIIDSKGLDEERRAHLLTSIQEKIDELSSCLMLVALCEEAFDVLSHMNHPDGDCPLCLYPLLNEDAHGNTWPFMKLMSCYHCFHSKCIIKWWNWLQKPTESDSNVSNPTSHPGSQTDLLVSVKNEGTCPVCRKVFQATDIEHVLNLIETTTSHLSLEETETDNDEGIQDSEYEKRRREDFEALYKLQEEKNGLIEPKKTILVLPGMYLPEPVAPPPELPTETGPTDEAGPASTPATEPEVGPIRGESKPGRGSRNNYRTGRNRTRHRNPLNAPTSSETAPNRHLNKPAPSVRQNPPHAPTSSETGPSRPRSSSHHNSLNASTPSETDPSRHLNKPATSAQPSPLNAPTSSETGPSRHLNKPATGFRHNPQNAPISSETGPSRHLNKPATGFRHNPQNAPNSSETGPRQQHMNKSATNYRNNFGARRKNTSTPAPTGAEN